MVYRVYQAYLQHRAGVKSSFIPRRCASSAIAAVLWKRATFLAGIER